MSKFTVEDIINFPKADLHRHLDGALRPEVLLRLARESGVRLPTYDLHEFRKVYQITFPKPMPIGELFKRFAWTVAVMRTPRGLYRAAYEQVLDLEREGIFYAEVRFAPGYHSIYPAPWYTAEEYERKPFPVMKLDEAVKNILDGLAQGTEETGVEVNLTICIPRESISLYGTESVFDVIRVAEQFQDRGVVAIDLACDESAYRPEDFIWAFRSTLGTRLRRDPHAGEMGALRFHNIQVSIESLHADGLGHAIPIYKSEYLMARVKEKNIRIERTPLSPVPGCSLKDGHLDELLVNGVPVSIASDDPVLMEASLTDNIRVALDFHHLGENELQILTANAVNTGFYRDATQKQRVRDRFVKNGLDPELLR